MKESTGASISGPASRLFPIVLCCSPLTSCLKGGLRRRSPMGQGNEKHAFPMVVHNQPPHQPRPVAVPETESLESGLEERELGKGGTSRHYGFSMRSRLCSDASSRRPLISAPSEFRHLNSGSFQFLQEHHSPHHRRLPSSQYGASLRPLELSIHTPENRVSPILTKFDYPGTVTPPPPACFAGRTDDDRPLLRQRSYSSMSFHIPRRHVVESSPSTVQDEVPPRIPPKALGRSRAHTAPDVEAIKERVASAMIEVERLQQQIEDVIERQSLYAMSRPSTSHSTAHTMPELEPMPSIPALPPTAPSFAERLNAEFDRPQTAPSKADSSITSRAKNSDGSSVSVEKTMPARRAQRPLPPPLPLVLRPPLRKKKSFSRVSTWLFPGAEQSIDMSSDSVTNDPRPVRGREGFYQCFVSDDSRRRQSVDSLDSASTWESDDEQRTVPTTWSLGSTPVTKPEGGPRLERTATFGKKEPQPVNVNVNVSVES